MGPPTLSPMSTRRIIREPGPFEARQLRPGDRYELHDGHAVYCAPTGGDGARATLIGAQVIDSDPLVEDAAIDTGFTTAPGMLRAPDIGRRAEQAGLGSRRAAARGRVHEPRPG